MIDRLDTLNHFCTGSGPPWQGGILTSDLADRSRPAAGTGEVARAIAEAIGPSLIAAHVIE